MSMLVSIHTWSRSLTAAVPFAWHYDTVFRWAVIGASIALAVFLLRLTNLPAQHTQTSAPALSVPPELSLAYGSPAAGAPPAPPVKIAPGRSLNSFTITRAPTDGFGTAPAAPR